MGLKTDLELNMIIVYGLANYHMTLKIVNEVYSIAFMCIQNSPNKIKHSIIIMLTVIFIIC